MRSLILALTDQFGTHAAAGSAREARTHITQLTDEYERAYYTGIVYERETRSYLERKNVVRSAAYDGFRHAMEWYERAEALRPSGNVDAVLRWNSCVRSSARGSSLTRASPRFRSSELLITCAPPSALLRGPAEPDLASSATCCPRACSARN